MSHSMPNMDPLGAAASVVAVLQLLSTVIGYLNDVKGASDERTRLLVELSSVSGLLSTLRDLALKSASVGAPLAAVKSLDVPLGPLSQFKAVLERLALTLSPGHGAAKQIGRLLAWPFKRGEVLDLLEAIERQKALFILALQNDNMLLSQQIKSDVSALNQGIHNLQMERVVDQRDRVLKWLRPSDTSTLHDSARKKYEPTTGNWFIHGEYFQAWKAGKPRLLWLHGLTDRTARLIAGCGKTVLCSTVIEHMQQFCRLHPNCVIAYHYFDWNVSEKQLVSTMLRSIIAQLAATALALSEAVSTLYTQERGNTQAPSIPTLLRTFLLVMEEIQMKVYVVIDGLDECTEKELLVETISHLLTSDSGNLRILLASRREREIEMSVEELNGCILQIEREKVDNDIAIHVNSRLLQDRQLRKWPDSVKEQIKTTLVSLSQGMFRWIVCQLDALRKCLKISVLKKVLTQLPKTLEESYDRIIQGILVEYKSEAYFALQWLAFSERPLHIKEVAEASVLDPSLDSFSPEDRLSDPQDILQICSSLVTILNSKEEQDQLRLAHFSVKEYFLGERIRTGPASEFSMREPDAHAHIAKVCLTLLVQFDQKGSLSQKSFDEFPLLRYSAQFWPNHIRKMRVDPLQDDRLRHLISTVLNPTRGECYVNWLRVYNPDYMGQPGELTSGLEDLPTPLYLASHLELVEITKKFLEEHQLDINSPVAHHGTALAAASFRGNQKVVELLLDAHSNVNAPAGHFKTALQAACYSGHERVAALLIGRGADINGQGRFGSPLQAAARFGNTNLIALLLERGASIDSRGKHAAFNTSLQDAARWGHGETVSFLLDRGSDVNLKANDGSTALQLSASNNHSSVVRILLRGGAKANAPAGDFGTALQEAARWGHEQCVRALLEGGADPNLMIGNYGSALQSAARWGHLSVVKALIMHGADINERGPRFGTALFAAKHWGHDGVAKLLVGSGAMDQSPEKSMSTATNWAGRNILPALLYGTQPPPAYS